MTNLNGGVLDGVRRITGRVRDLVIDGTLPGVPLGFRLRGATSVGPPAAGTWRRGDIVPDRQGALWTCVTAGTPGKWQPAGGIAVVPPAAGTAADAAAIASAVTAAGANGTVCFPPGTYTADSLAPLNGQTWYGPATIQRPSGSTNSVITATGLTGFTMRGLTVDGNSGNSSATTNAAVYLINSAWCRLEGVTVQNTPSANAGIILRGAVRCIIDACQLTSCGYGILLGLNHGDNYNCYGNIIRGCTIDTTVNDAIFLSENLGSTGSVSVTGSVIGTVVTGCVVRNFGDCGIEVGSGTVYTEVSGCTFDGISNGNGNNGILFRDSANSSVTGCTVSNLTKAGSTGVYMVNLNGSNSHISVNSVDVTNCGYGYIVQGGTSGSNIGTAALDIAFNGGVIDGAAINGINLVNVNGFSVTGTQVYASSQQGIAVGKFSTASSGCTDGTITGARVFNSGQGATGQAGIILFQSTADVSITGCRIGDNQGAGATQAYGVRVFDSTVTNVTVSECDLTNGGLTANLASAAASSSGIRAFRNLGFNPQGMQSVTLSGTSPATYTAGITPEVLYLNGGSSVSLAKNSLALPYNSASGSAYPLEPGESVVISWSVSAPNFSRSDRK